MQPIKRATRPDLYLKTPLKNGLRLLSKLQFDKLSVHQRRVAICRDAKKRVKLSLILPNSGSVVKGWGLNSITGNGSYTPREVQAAINREQRCQACAKGGLLLTWVGNFDSFGSPEMRAMERQEQACSVSHGYPAGLVATFGDRLMAAVECAFETDNPCEWLNAVLNPTQNGLLKAAFVNPDASNRFLAIMSNIIKHRGKLVIDDGQGGKLVFD